jgi:hypothetical protein
VSDTSSEFIKQDNSESKKRARSSDSVKLSIIPLSNDSLTKSIHTYENDGRKLFTKKKIVNKIEINLKDRIGRLNSSFSKSFLPVDESNHEVFNVKKVRIYSNIFLFLCKQFELTRCFTYYY